MAFRVLVNEFPHRTLALATDDYALVFRHTHSTENGQTTSATSLPLPHTARQNATARCMVEFAPASSVDLSKFRILTIAKGSLGLITLKNDVFICVVTGSIEAATLRPGETVQKIYEVEFYCLNRSDYDHSHAFESSPYPGHTFASEEFDYGAGLDQNDTISEHPFHALKKLLSGGNFYYSVDFDLTRRLQDRAEGDTSVDIASLDEGLLWNSYLIDPLLQFRSRLTNHERDALDNSCMLTSVIRGFAKTLTVPPSASPIRRAKSNIAATITVISRLSSRRAGTRFNSRGVDDNGNVANFVETETVFWSPTGLCFSYTQVRGSIPIFWESASSLIPGQQKIHITRSPEATQPSFDRHFAMLEKTYGAIHVVNLLSVSKVGENELSDRYRFHIERSPLQRPQAGDVEKHNLLRATEFDFHERTRGAGGYEGAKAIRPFIDASAESFVYFLSEEIDEYTTLQGERHQMRRAVVIMQQNGVFRVNCLDCLDRTNLVQGMVSQMALELFLSHRSEIGSSDFWMRHSTLWADNGDALSKIYAGTGALKSSFTRTGKMSLAGAFADARKSATRLYVNHFEDKGRQNTIDLLLGRLVGQSTVDLFDPVNDWVVSELTRRKAEFESRAQVKVYVGSYNLNGKTTGVREDLSPWLDVRGKGYDIIAIGFQEIVELSPQQIMSTDPNRRMAWESAVRECLNNYQSDKPETAPDGDGYVLLRSGQLVGAALLVFVRSSMLERIQNVEGAIKKTGMSGIAGNKGAVAIRMEIDNTSACFVTAHLAAGFGNYDERNRDYNTITSGLRFQRDRSIDDHEVIVWAGDFNYRIGLSYEKTKQLVHEYSSSSGTNAENALGKLYENDQLNIQMVAGNCFGFYREGRVDFLPTYKYDLGKDEFDSSDKQRIPAWTDRILWKVNQNSLQQGDDSGSRMKQLEYNSVMAMRFSDHRPVYASFEMGVRVVDEHRKDELIKKLYQKRAKDVGARTEDGVEDESENEEVDELMGYQSIQEGLPPASSDKRKWWLDGEKGVKSRIGAPREGLTLNKNRPPNPWKDGAEDDWVQVEKPDIGSRNDSKGTSPIQTSRSSTPKPDPPPARGTRRMVPPAWEGDRHSSHSTTISDGYSDLKSSRITPPTPTRARAGSREGSVTSNTSSNTASTPTSMTSKKPAPPKPVKPSALTTMLSRPESQSDITSRTLEQKEGVAPPLPKRTNTTTSTASTTSFNTIDSTIQRKALPSPVQPRRVSKLQEGEQRRDVSVSSPTSTIPNTGASEVGPPLPPRRPPAASNVGLMDDDSGMGGGEDGELKGWEVLKPR